MHERDDEEEEGNTFKGGRGLHQEGTIVMGVETNPTSRASYSVRSA
jgi:hypothetical protein